MNQIIKVIGIGGAGNNAVNFMHSLDVQDVDLIICNTDLNTLNKSSVQTKVQLGPKLTQGLGAGSKPEVGKLATEESIHELKNILQNNTKMVFLTAGMGGGTGTGGAPVIARLCKELNILTVAVVTLPFSREGSLKLKYAHDAIEELKQYVDTLIIINNDKLHALFGNLKFGAAFKKADEVLSNAIISITNITSNTGQINIDFADVYNVMKNGGMALIAQAQAQGHERSIKIVEQVLNCPLLNDNDIYGARSILMNFASPSGEHEISMDEVDMITNVIRQKAGGTEDIDIKIGMVYNEELGERIALTLVATNFDQTKNTLNKKQEKQNVTLNLQSHTNDKQKTILDFTEKEPNNINTQQEKPTIHDKNIPLNVNQLTNQTTMPLHIKEDNNQPQQTHFIKHTTPDTTNDDQDKMNRINKYKSLSLNFDFDNPNSDIYNVPAYKKSLEIADNIDNHPNNVSNNNVYSKTYVNDKEKDNSILSFNKFLDAHKPD